MRRGLANNPQNRLNVNKLGKYGGSETETVPAALIAV